MFNNSKTEYPFKMGWYYMQVALNTHDRRIEGAFRTAPSTDLNVGSVRMLGSGMQVISNSSKLSSFNIINRDNDIHKAEVIDQYGAACNICVLSDEIKLNGFDYKYHPDCKIFITDDGFVSSYIKYNVAEQKIILCNYIDSIVHEMSIGQFLRMNNTVLSNRLFKIDKIFNALMYESCSKRIYRSKIPAYKFQQIKDIIIGRLAT